ncbi:MAG: 50S ribosomal protein L11, partial [Candidatus Hecatellaceae archaeon]
VEKGSGNPKEEKIGNLTLEQVKKIARIKLGQSYAKTLKYAALEVLGTCVSMGVTVEGKDPKEVQKEMREGVHDEFFREET